MDKIKSVGTGEVVNTPTLKKFLMEDLAEELLKQENAKYKDGFQDKMVYKCGVCKGTGFDPWDNTVCKACEGSGIDYEIQFGIQDGMFYARTVQYGIAFFKEMCKAMREAELEATLKDKQSMIGRTMFRLPAVIDMELQARGFSPEDIRGSGPRHKEVIQTVQRDFPDFMCSNLRY